MSDSYQLFNKALQALSMGNLPRAVAYPLQWLYCFCTYFTEEVFSYDHEGSEFCQACEEAMNIIDKVMTNPKADTDFKEKIIIELSGIAENTTIFDDYCFANLKAFTRRMKALTLSGDEALAIIEELIGKEEYGIALSDLIIQKSDILFAMNKNEDAIRFLENNICEKEVCEHLITILNDRKEYNHILNVLEKRKRLQRHTGNCSSYSTAIWKSTKLLKVVLLQIIGKIIWML